MGTNGVSLRYNMPRVSTPSAFSKINHWVFLDLILRYLSHDKDEHPRVRIKRKFPRVLKSTLRSWRISRKTFTHSLYAECFIDAFHVLNYLFSLSLERLLKLGIKLIFSRFLKDVKSSESGNSSRRLAKAGAKIFRGENGENLISITFRTI